MSVKQGNNYIAAGGGSVAIDELSITENSSNKIQTVGVIDQNNTSNAIKTWAGTRAQYDAIATKDSSTLYNITDDTDLNLPILEALYPVGSTYITTANTCPLSTLISGSTWELVSSGRVLQGADSGHSAGTTIEAGLPNITGKFRIIGNQNAYGADNFSGVFTSENLQEQGNYTKADNGNLNIGVRYIKFNASRSSSIYGNSNTVQPPAYVVNIFRRTA